MDIDIDEEVSQYGQPQYHEADVIPCMPDEVSESRERSALRRAVLENHSASPVTNDGSRQRWENSPDTSDTQPPGPSCESTVSENTDSSQSGSTAESHEQVIHSLRAKLKEQHILVQRTDHFKCLICMEPYRNPATSVICWHVHCEECWLRSLGTKKVCPQCTVITSPTDLRRIYL